MPLPTGDPGDIEISFGDIIGNRGQAESDVEIKAESEFFALGASVGDVDGNGTPDETADRDALDAAPYSISEFYGAHLTLHRKFIILILVVIFTKSDHLSAFLDFGLGYFGGG